MRDKLRTAWGERLTQGPVRNGTEGLSVWEWPDVPTPLLAGQLLGARVLFARSEPASAPWWLFTTSRASSRRPTAATIGAGIRRRPRQIELYGDDHAKSSSDEEDGDDVVGAGDGGFDVVSAVDDVKESSGSTTFWL